MITEFARGFEGDGFGLAVVIVAGELVFETHFVGAADGGDFGIVDLDVKIFFIVFEMIKADGGANDGGDNDNDD